jgi:hypothetical protein
MKIKKLFTMKINKNSFLAINSNASFLPGYNLTIINQFVGCSASEGLIAGLNVVENYPDVVSKLIR